MLDDDTARCRSAGALNPRSCFCGSSEFECLGWYCCDAVAHDLTKVPLDQWDKAFGALAAWFICSSCGIAQQVVRGNDVKGHRRLTVNWRVEPNKS